MAFSLTKSICYILCILGTTVIGDNASKKQKPPASRNKFDAGRNIFASFKPVKKIKVNLVSALKICIFNAYVIWCLGRVPRERLYFE